MLRAVGVGWWPAFAPLVAARCLVGVEWGTGDGACQWGMEVGPRLPPT